MSLLPTKDEPSLYSISCVIICTQCNITSLSHVRSKTTRAEGRLALRVDSLFCNERMSFKRASASRTNRRRLNGRDQ